MKKQICVIGMGRYGSIMAHELYQSGHDVLAIDMDEAKIQEQLGKVTYAVRADATTESVLRELDVPDYDVVIVALGSENIQASVGITVLLKSLQVPMVMARAANELHGDTLERVGADRVSPPAYWPCRGRHQQDPPSGCDDWSYPGRGCALRLRGPPRNFGACHSQGQSIAASSRAERGDNGWRRPNPGGNQRAVEQIN